MGEFTSLDQVRKQIRDNMEAEKRHTAERAAKDKLVADLVKQNDFEVPEALVDRQIDLRLERGLRALAAQGMKMEDLKKMDLPRLRAGQREQAVHDVKSSLLLERIAELEKIQVTDEEVNREIDALAKQSKQTSEAVRARLTEDGGLDRIRIESAAKRPSIFFITSPRKLRNEEADTSTLPEITTLVRGGVWQVNVKHETNRSRR